jgi:hypothetical protein
MVLILDGNTIDLKDEQFAKALHPILSQVWGRMMELRLWQPWKTPDPMDERAVEVRSTAVREGHEWKAESEIRLMAFGKEHDLRLKH